MNPTLNQQRLWGGVLVLGGLLTALGYLLYPSTSGPDVIVTASQLVFLGVPLIVMGLVAFSVGQSVQADIASWAGTALTAMGIALVSNHAILTLADRHFLDDTDAYHSSIAGSYEFYGLIAIAVGILTLAIATFRAGVYPRWVAWSLVANLVITGIASNVPAVGDAVHTPVPSYVLVAVLGVAMLGSKRPVETVVPDPVPTAVG